MIISFSCPDTEAVFQRSIVGRWPRSLQEKARMKLVMLDAAHNLADLRNPPSTRLEKLKGNRKDQYSIRVNDQWRICFQWRAGNAYQ
ncbi:MAG: type II toxin-antitoxin system RelE/ParE family toxin, partial [Phycisphaerales bacterium]|nr:type II toxin-antitoxin system RelE/ParE family toxin [Phycisphaerales bacterium]